MPERWRTFIAAPVPRGVCEALGADLAPLLADAGNGRWVPLATLHLTLAFLGSTTPDRVDEIRQVMAETASRHAQFRAALGDPGSFRDRSDSAVTWIALREGSADFTQLMVALRRALQERGLMDWPRGARREPRPHVTLARRSRPDLAPTITTLLSDGARRPWQVRELVLYRSHLGARDERYERLAGVFLPPPAGA